ncbi:uncharacterized protein DNG_00341 [Cephalotrichum gorgonifer]|uniref:Uncharacterized protein n=1 Tax=Cephalotrichum gorgonifer TaxID=2041049 RepID=A0AAE8MR31_9PEZI|nr:uncharacterized protein DNG_00341 [Cephalotrichum gorgonifer]
MGFFDHDTVSVVSRKSHDGRPKYKVERRKKSRSRSRSRSRSPKRSESRSLASALFGVGGSSKHHRSSSRHHGGGSSIFGGGGKHHSGSRSSFFGIPTGSGSRSSLFGFGRSSPSYYKRSPRKNFMERAIKKVKQLFRDLVRYAKRHPVKVFMLVIVPLVTSGALVALLARVGLKLPSSFENLVTTAGKFASGDSAGLVGEAMKMAGGLGSMVGK